MLKKLWMDDCGAVLTTELILLVVILVLGIGVGLTALRDGVVAELSDVAQAIASIDPGYAFAGITYSQSGSTIVTKTYGTVYNSQAGTAGNGSATFAPTIVDAFVATGTPTAKANQ